MGQESVAEALSGLMGHCKVMMMQIKSLVMLLPNDKQDEWLRLHESNCAQIGIHPITGVSDSDVDQT